jgi:hypothetical protein
MERNWYFFFGPAWCFGFWLFGLLSPLPHDKGGVVLYVYVYTFFFFFKFDFNILTRFGS